jgi:hypothetical protein
MSIVSQFEVGTGLADGNGDLAGLAWETRSTGPCGLADRSGKKR